MSISSTRTSGKNRSKRVLSCLVSGARETHDKSTLSRVRGKSQQIGHSGAEGEGEKLINARW